MASCRPPPVAALDVRKNEVPLSNSGGIYFRVGPSWDGHSSRAENPRIRMQPKNFRKLLVFDLIAMVPSTSFYCTSVYHVSLWHQHSICQKTRVVGRSSGLYAAASIGGLNAPNLYFIVSRLWTWTHPRAIPQAHGFGWFCSLYQEDVSNLAQKLTATSSISFNRASQSP